MDEEANEISINCDDSGRRENTPTSVDDLNRRELLWEKREEKLLMQWCKDCQKRSHSHDVKGKQNKIKFAMFGVPSILIPIVLGGVASMVPCHSIIYSVAMMCSGLFSGINMFFNFGGKERDHNAFMNKYFELSVEIESELSKPKRFRIACDVYVERVKLIYNGLCKTSPSL
jgi:hypothetical protein